MFVSDMKKYSVYLMVCPITKEPVYIGKTCDIEKRMAAHYSLVGGRQIDKFLAVMILNKLDPIIKILHSDIEDNEEAIKLERKYISDYRGCGFNMLNNQDRTKYEKAYYKIKNYSKYLKMATDLSQ